MTEHKASPELWAHMEGCADSPRDTANLFLELRARIEALEGKYETMRLATLEWGEDIDNHSRWIDDQLKRIMALEAAANDRQQNEDNERAMPDAPPADGLVERVADAIYRNGTGVGSREEARAAILEVAAWLREKRPAAYSPGADLLEPEVNR